SKDEMQPQPGTPCRQNTRKWIFTWIGTCLTCTCLVFGQSSDCEPGNVLNNSGDHWSEQCYLNNACEEQGNPCTANDVQMTGLFVANADGEAIQTCENNESVSLYLWGQFD